MKRRDYLSGLAGIGALSAMGTASADSDVRALSLSSAITDDTHHPGPPRFGEVGNRFYDRMFTDFSNDDISGKDRDNFSPRIVGDADRDAENYNADDFSWSIAQAPEDSQAELEYAPSDNDTPQYNSGANNVVEFAPDVPGTYILELDAPDGTHQQKLQIFPQRNSNAGGPPRISIDGHYDSENSEFVLESNPQLAPNSPATERDIVVEWLSDDRDALADEDIQTGEGTDTWTARIPKSALGGEESQIYACPTDGMIPGYEDTVILNPDEDAVEYPNRPPEWIKNGIMYEIFPRSFEGPPEEGEWPLYNSNANFKNMAREERLDYLESLNIDVIWFTPVVPSESANWKPQNADAWDSEGGNRFKFVGGGPHGYDALSYFEIAEDLGSEVGFNEYADEPWPWEEGYDPDNNRRVDARENAMEEFQTFIEECHDRDIKVCFDFVINHGGRHHPLFQDTIAGLQDNRPPGWTYKGIESNNTSSKYFDWFARQDTPITDSDGNVVDPAPAATGFAGLRVMPQWNYGNVALREHILAAADFLSSEDGVNLDAFRCDIAYGVPHSFWKEVRDVVLENDSEFMMLDETIPNDPDFAEDEFDLHFDTADFMASAGHGVVNGNDPMSLYDAVAKRDIEGWPEHSLITNSTENHDEQRLYKIARNGPREDPAKAQRAVWAAGVVLPGVPFIYYGQERLITEYGENRYNYDGSGEDYRTGDAGRGNFKRAFMNWDEYPEDHLEFYRDVTAFYKETDALKPDADLEPVWFQSDDDVLVAGRTLETDEGEQNYVAIVHFDPGTAQVDLLPGTSTQDMFTDSDISVDSEGEAVTLGVDTLALVETDSLYSVGQQITQLTESAGDDNGPGSYTYPTGDAYADGAFDISGFSVHNGVDTYQFQVSLAGELTNPEDLAEGFSHQHVQVYFSNPNAENGATEGRTGTNITLGRPYQYVLVADGENGARVEDHEGNVVAEGSVMTNPVSNELVIEMPKSVIDANIRGNYIAPVMLGYKSDADGGVMPVAAEAGPATFGGAETPGMAPRVIDAVLPDTATQSEALAYGEDSMATVPFTSLATEFAKLGETSDPTGDENGPGNYQLPTAPEDDFYEGMFDMTRVTISQSRARVQIEYEIAAELQNVFGLEGGFSNQFPQVYIRDPEAGSDVPSSTEARTGVNANFAQPYHYRVAVNGQGTQVVENGAGESTSTDVNVTLGDNTIAFDFPMSAVGGSLEGKQIAALMTPFDGYGAGSVRQGFAAEPGEYVIGTSGENAGNAPRVMDMVTPEGTSQGQALAYTGSAKAQIPFADWGVFEQVTTAGTISDPTGDDAGPGSYTYPTSDQIPEGCFDVSQVEITNTTQTWDFTVHIDGPVNNPWDYNAGFSQQLFQIYMQDPGAGEDAPTTTQGRTGMTSTFQEPYHYRAHVSGSTQLLEDAAGETVSEELTASGNPDDGTITFSVPKAAFSVDSFSELKVSMLVFSQDGFGSGGIRQNYAPEAGQWAFGGVEANADKAPRVIDLVAPEGVVDQSEALAFSADSTASIPLTKAEYLISGELPQTDTPSAIAAPGPTIFAGREGTVTAANSSDPNGQELSFSWEQTAGPDVQSMSGGDSDTLTFTAPEVSEESQLEFTVTVSDPDGNSATATTTATVMPQSANPAPNPVAKVGVGVEQPVPAGEQVTVNAYDSSDPNGGSLSYAWAQAGGPSVELGNANGTTTFFDAPEVDSQSTVTLELTVDDGQGKSASTTVDIQIAAASGGGTTETPTDSMGGDTTTTDDTGGAATTTAEDGPGFGVVSGALGTAGGIAYAARRLLGDDPEEVEMKSVEDVEPVEEEEEE